MVSTVEGCPFKSRVSLCLRNLLIALNCSKSAQPILKYSLTAIKGASLDRVLPPQLGGQGKAASKAEGN